MMKRGASSQNIADLHPSPAAKRKLANQRTERIQANRLKSVSSSACFCGQMSDQLIIIYTLWSYRTFAPNVTKDIADFSFSFVCRHKIDTRLYSCIFVSITVGRSEGSRVLGENIMTFLHYCFIESAPQ